MGSPLFVRSGFRQHVCHQVVFEPVAVEVGRGQREGDTPDAELGVRVLDELPGAPVDHLRLGQPRDRRDVGVDRRRPVHLRDPDQDVARTAAAGVLDRERDHFLTTGDEALVDLRGRNEGMPVGAAAAVV